MATEGSDAPTLSALSTVQTTLVLGYYDRFNVGDEQYKTTIPLFFGAAFDFEFVCIDDARGVDLSRYELVICGGGDIINPYFMNKVEALLAKYTGPTYAFSVGIPYDNDIAYIDLFDHVVVRSQYDYDKVSRRLGTANVTLMPDCGFLMSSAPKTQETDARRFGVCIATPILLENEEYTKQLASAISMFLSAMPQFECHFFIFNTDPVNLDESDIDGIQKIFGYMDQAALRSCFVRSELIMAHDIVDGLASMAFTVCMRYHSLVFSIKAGVPPIAIVATKKMQQLAIDVGLDKDYMVDVDKMEAVSGVMMKRLLDATELESPDVGRYQSNEVLRHAFGDRKYRQLIIQPSQTQHKSLQETVAACVEILNALYGYTHITMESVFAKGPFLLANMDPTRVARVVCFAITGDYENQCVWGLSQNLFKEDFVLFDAIVYIYDEMHSVNLDPQQEAPESYYPLVLVDKRPMLSIDPFLDSKTINKVHRSGWSFVVNHLRNYQASRFRRPASMIVDTYVERTFHWGFDALMLSGFLPYRSTWIGFVHHTFDETHSTFNCEQLFRNEVFIASLVHCKCLFVLSEYLAKQVRDKLRTKGLDSSVDVKVLTHPTEFVDMTKEFTMTKFMNGDRKLVQVGAWLRNSFSIFILPLFMDKLNPLGISKAALIGNDMSGYYVAPDKFNEIIEAIESVDDGLGPGYTCDETRTLDINSRNKFIEGLINALISQYKSVEIWEKLSNEDYDTLFESSMVFLNLVDCSAANTVLECIVRNTIIVVNRHPALEEVLGKGYPGFYETVVEAALLLADLDRLNACYLWLCNIDKTGLRIDTFVNAVVDISNSIVGKLV